jgi:hypothetical protein
VSHWPALAVDSYRCWRRCCWIASSSATMRWPAALRWTVKGAVFQCLSRMCVKPRKSNVSGFPWSIRVVAVVAMVPLLLGEGFLKELNSGGLVFLLTHMASNWVAVGQGGRQGASASAPCSAHLS